MLTSIRFLSGSIVKLVKIPHFVQTKDVLSQSCKMVDNSKAERGVGGFRMELSIVQQCHSLASDQGFRFRSLLSGW